MPDLHGNRAILLDPSASQSYLQFKDAAGDACSPYLPVGLRPSFVSAFFFAPRHPADVLRRPRETGPTPAQRPDPGLPVRRSVRRSAWLTRATPLLDAVTRQGRLRQVHAPPFLHRTHADVSEGNAKAERAESQKSKSEFHGTSPTGCMYLVYGRPFAPDQPGLNFSRSINCIRRHSRTPPQIWTERPPGARDQFTMKTMASRYSASPISPNCAAINDKRNSPPSVVPTIST